MYAVIMAGGSGTRFWPASREHLPKQFLKITSDRTMIEETLDRVRTFTSVDKVLAVVGKIHEEVTRKLIGSSVGAILAEPFGRNTAACIGLAALKIKQAAIDDPIVILPADHYISDLEQFRDTILAAAEIARTGAIVTLGITPSRPETGYGYIQTSAPAGEIQGRRYLDVERFVEKPDYRTAVNYLNQGGYYWNSGIFIFTARTILEEFERCLPDLSSGLHEIEAAINSQVYEKVLESVYQRIPSISIDYGVMEKTTRSIFVIPADFAWSDVGSWQALYELRSPDYDENDNLLLGEAMISESRGNLVYSASGRKVALLGVEGLFVVDTPDALLVADLDHSQDVKRFPEILKGMAQTPK